MGKKKTNKKSDWNKDFYTRKAQEDDYRARSAYKLQEINNKHPLFHKGDSVLDLGCAPGSWLQYVLKKIGPTGTAIGIDLQETTVAGAICHHADIYSFDYGTLPRFDAVISDMAPGTSGQPFVDAQRSLELCMRAFEIAEATLKKGGSFVCKIFQGEDIDAFFRELRPRFARMSRFKPASSREKSREIFFIGNDFLG